MTGRSETIELIRKESSGFLKSILKYVIRLPFWISFHSIEIPVLSQRSQNCLLFHVERRRRDCWFSFEYEIHLHTVSPQVLQLSFCLLNRTSHSRKLLSTLYIRVSSTLCYRMISSNKKQTSSSLRDRYKVRVNKLQPNRNPGETAYVRTDESGDEYSRDNIWNHVVNLWNNNAVVKSLIHS